MVDRTKWLLIATIAACRSNTPEMTAHPVATPTATVDFCRSIADASHAALARANVKHPELPPCRDGECGGWAFRIDDAIAVPSEDSPGGNDVGYVVVLVHRDARGALATYDLPTDKIGDATRTLLAAVTNRNYYGSHFISSLVVGDVDGDRDPEAFVSGGVAEEGPQDGWTRLLTFKRERIEPYGPAAGIDLDDAKDIDGDGRIDILTSGPYSHVRATSAFGSTYSILDGVFVAHALADGTFSLDDKVVRAALVKTCPNAAAFAMPQHFDPETVVMEIVCARAWGASAADIEIELASRCASYEDWSTDDATCPSELLDVARIDPPFRLP